VAAGSSHSLALKNDGTVWAWGYNTSQQLGDGTTTQRTTPVQVVGLNGVIAIAATSTGSIALKSDGTIWTWGNPGISTSVPTKVASLSGRAGA
jgi:alpha-tubulin suppressor-like RCC1 family protein